MSLLLPARRSLILPQKPTVVAAWTEVAGGTPITLTLRRRDRDVLLVAVILSNVGAAPATPSGWTSLANSVTPPAYRAAYKFCDGSEAPTVTSAATSATAMFAAVYAFTGIPRPWLPTHGGVVTGSSTTPDPGSFATAGQTGRRVLFLTYAGWQGDATLTGWPSRYAQARITDKSTALGIAAISRFATELTEDVGAFTISSTLPWRAATFAIPGL